MTKRERELHERHISVLEDSRDALWRGISSGVKTTSQALQTHEALEYAIKTLKFAQ